MKMAKTILLGTAAALVGTVGASAADLRAAPPVQFVQVCDAAGAGFWVLPGTDVCVSVNGTVYMGLYAQSANFAAQANNNANAGALRFNPFNGPVGANVISPNLNPQTFIFANGRVQTRSFQRTDIGIIRTTINVQGDTGAVGDINVGLRQAWVSVTNAAGVFTAGLTETFFAPAAGVGIGSGVTNSGSSFTSGLGFSHSTILGNEAGSRRAAFAYTAVLAPNATATIAIENNVQGIGVNAAGAQVVGIGGGTAFNVQNNVALGNTGASLAGQNLPALVANVMLGTAASGNFIGLSGAVVSNRVFDVGAAGTGGTFATTGWAVAAVAGLNADVISRGSRFGVRVAYSDGASQYLGNGAPAQNAWFGRVNGGPAVRNIAGFAASAAYTHQWNPQWRTALYAGFLSMNYRGNAAFAASNISGGNIFSGIGSNGGPSFLNVGVGAGSVNNTTLVGWNNTNLLRSAWQVGTTTMWTPVSGFSVGLDLSVVQGRFTNTFGGNGSGMGGVRTGYTGILGVRRDF
jgi:hypothetical protein